MVNDRKRRGYRIPVPPAGMCPRRHSIAAIRGQGGDNGGFLPHPVMRSRRRIVIPEDEVEVSAVRAQGAGGQNVNKVSSAIHLRFDIRRSSLPEDVQARLLALGDQRITKEGVLVIKAQSERSRERNLEEALRRLHELVDSVALPPLVRRPTRPTFASRERRMEGKNVRSRIKSLRGKVQD